MLRIVAICLGQAMQPSQWQLRLSWGGASDSVPEWVAGKDPAKCDTELEENLFHTGSCKYSVLRPIRPGTQLARPPCIY